ncbi:hypothetical protein M8C21_001708, partial [Ambrosia artemisiifolia]
AREINLGGVCSNPNLPRNGLIHNSADDNFIASQLVEIKNSRSHIPYDPSPVVTDAPSASLSLQTHKSPTKSNKAQVLSSPTLNRAISLQNSLGNEFPSCIRVMRGSQVTKGWKRFVVGHKLMEGDVLLFHLVEATKFKVYIFKADVSSEVANPVPVNLLNSEAHPEQITPELNDVITATSPPKTKKNKHPESLSLTEVQKRVKRHRKSTTPSTSEPRSGHLIGHVGNNTKEIGSAVPKYSRPPIPNLSFQEVKSFEDFRVVVNGHSIDAELLDDVRMGYYKLCFYKKQFLHDGVEDNMNSMLVVGMITEIVRIGNAIKKCKPTTTKEEFERWDKSLISFEGLGMKVGFLRDKIHTLERLVFESEGALDRKKCTEAQREHKRVKAEAKEVAAKLQELKKSAKNFRASNVVLCSCYQWTYKAITDVVIVNPKYKKAVHCDVNKRVQPSPSTPMNSLPSSDHQHERQPSNLSDTGVTIAQLPPSKTPPPLALLTPSSKLMGKRKWLKPERLEFSSVNALHDPSRNYLRKENATIDSTAPVQISQTMIRAREVQLTLGNEYPSFIKTMVRSHVTSCFWMVIRLTPCTKCDNLHAGLQGLPSPFCRSFLPKHDSLMVLEDEDGKQFNLKFIGNRSGFSAGWGKFAIRHKLLEGDVLIFQLVESCKFKVYIVRANNSKDIDGVVKVINQDGHAEHKSPVNSQVQGGSTKANLSLQDVKTFNDFHIMVDKQCIDSELSDEIRMNYFTLCIGKNEILHKGVREGLYYKLVAGVIGETVKIANMIRNCKLTTRMEEFAVWDSSLEYFELIGMKVGFLRDRIRELASLAFFAFESEDAKKYVEAKEELNWNANEIKVLEAKLVDLYESNRKLNEVVDGFIGKTEKFKIEFQKKKPPNLPETDVTIDQLTPSKTLAPLTPSSDLTGKRKRLKPQRLEFSLEKKRSRLKDKGVHDPSRKRLRKENASKDSKAPLQISQTMIRAREVQSTLGNECPSFIKTMVKSHVTTCFWMGLPLPFCKRFLPQHDSLIVIEDEDGKQANLKFIAYRFGLSAGWGKFAVRHKLLEGDVLIFQLVESCKFKVVYIVRANNSKDVDGVAKVINQDGHSEHKSPATVKKNFKSKGRKCSSSSSPPLTKVKRKYIRSKPPTQLNSHHTDHPVVNSQVQEGPPKPKFSLKDAISFKDFSIMVNKECIDTELSEEIRMDYYNLCIGKNEILHNGVREGLYYKLVAGVIGETVNIANMLRNCKLTTKKEEYAGWDSSLESFELMGMKVGFLRDRIRALTSLAFESEDAKTYAEVKEEQNRNANEIKVLQAKLVELYESNKKINEVMDGLKEKAERYEIEFQRKVDAPW